jgi:hypothetical protein
MSIQVAQRTKTELKQARSAVRHARGQTRQQRLYQEEVLAVSNEIAVALTHSRNRGVVYADSEELLLLIVAAEIGLIEEMPDEQSARRRARQVDNATGYKKHQQGDRQQLMRDAVNHALENGMICKHDDRDGSPVAFYLPQNQPPKWTAFFADNQKGIADYVPSKRELAIALLVSDYNTLREHEEEVVRLTSHDLALLRAWGEQFTL